MVCGDLNFFMTVKRTAVTEREGGSEGVNSGCRASFRETAVYAREYR